MASHILILTIVMLLAGIFGGLINYYLYENGSEDPQSLPRCLVVGVGASFLIPVILDFLNSDLVVETQGDSSRLLIFTGFCLIAALISRFFISNLPDRILREAVDAKTQARAMQTDLQVIQKELLPLIDTETENDNQGLGTTDMMDIDEELDVTSVQVLKILGSGRYIFRSLSGLCTESGADETTVLRTLNYLVSKSLSGQVRGKSGTRWHLTEKGREVLKIVS